MIQFDGKFNFQTRIIWFCKVRSFSLKYGGKFLQSEVCHSKGNLLFHIIFKHHLSCWSLSLMKLYKTHFPFCLLVHVNNDFHIELAFLNFRSPCFHLWLFALKTLYFLLASQFFLYFLIASQFYLLWTFNHHISSYVTAPDIAWHISLFHVIASFWT